MTLQKSALAAAVSMAISSGFIMPAVAAMDQHRNDFAAMTDDSSVNLDLRNFYFHRNFRDQRMYSGSNAPLNPNNYDIHKAGRAEAWAQGFRLNLQSGYFRDVIGIDASWYGSVKLAGNTDKWGSNALREASPSFKMNNLHFNEQRKQKSYDKLGQIFLKTQFGNEESVNAHIKAGRMYMDTPLLNDDDARVTPTTTQALMADLNWGDFTVYGFSSDKASNHTQSGFKKYEGYSNSYNGMTHTPGEKGDWKVNSLGASFANEDGFGANLQLANAKEYKKQAYINPYYTISISEDTSLLLDGHFYKGKGNGKYLEKEMHGGMYKDWDSKLFNLATQLKISDLKLALSYQKVQGDTYDPQWGVSDDTGFKTWHDIQYKDFSQANEKSWGARVDYDFAGMGLPGWNFMTRYVKGEFKEGNMKKLNEWERNTDIMYSFPEGSLKGLSVKLRNAIYRVSGRSNNTNVNENRLIVDYTLALL